MKKPRYTLENIQCMYDYFGYASDYEKSKCKHLSEEKLELFRKWVWSNRRELIDWKIYMPLEPAHELYEPILNDVRVKLEEGERLTLSASTYR